MMEKVKKKKRWNST